MESVTKIGLLLALILASAAAAAGQAAGPDPPPETASRLLDAARRATGGAAWARVRLVHEQLRLKSGGLDGTVERWADPAHGRYALHYVLGPDRGAEGWDGQGAWDQDWGGRVHRLDDDSLGPARAGALWQSFAFLFAEQNGLAARLMGRRHEDSGRNFEVVQIRPPGGGDAIELWLDRQTALPDRVILRGSPNTVVRFADYREIQGLMLPGTVATSGGPAGSDSLETLATAELDPQDAADPFAAPPAAPPDYRFASGTDTRAALIATGDSFVVNVEIDGKGPYRFALDTGAGNAIDADLARELGLATSGALGARGAGEAPVAFALTRAARVEIGGVTLSDQLFRVLDLSRIAAGDHPPYRGLLGAEFFDRFVVALDPEHNAVELDEPAGWRYPGDEPPVPFRFHGRTPAVDGQIDLVPGRFTLDTGQANSLTLYRPFLQRTGIERKYPPKLTATVGMGVGGPIRAEVARGRLLLLGRTEVTAPVLFLSLQQRGAFSDPDLAGNIGSGVFARFETIFDYARRRVYFEPVRTDHGDSLKLMVVKPGPTGLEVLSVLRGGPLAEAGVKRGDIIESIGPQEATRIDEPELERIFRRPAGTAVPMTVRSGGRIEHITVVLGELV